MKHEPSRFWNQRTANWIYGVSQGGALNAITGDESTGPTQYGTTYGVMSLFCLSIAFLVLSVAFGSESLQQLSGILVAIATTLCVLHFRTDKAEARASARSGPLRPLWHRACVIACLLPSSLVMVALTFAWIALLIRGFENWATTTVALLSAALLIMATGTALAINTRRVIVFARGVANTTFDIRCTKCRYSLAGLHVSNGTIECPECGLRWKVP